MKIIIENLKFQAIIGILDFERKTAQDIIITTEIDYEYSDAFINYAEVSALIKETMIASKFLLIEDALSAVSKMLKLNFSKIKNLKIKITKPSILPDCTVSVSEEYDFNA